MAAKGILDMDASLRLAPTYRSILWVPGNREDWMLKAPKFGADAYAYDLEDSVPIAEKERGRAAVQVVLAAHAGQPFGRLVRLNAWDSGHTVADLLAVVRDGLDGVMLAKTESPADVLAVDRILGDLERARGLEVGKIEIVPQCETAKGAYYQHDICLASDRVRRTGIIGAETFGADLARSVGITATSDDGSEVLYVTGRTALEARAAGVTQVIAGMTTKIDDLGLVRRLAVRAKTLGATGCVVVHPSHAVVCNEVFAPSAEEIKAARALVNAFSEGLADGKAAMRHEGRLIDYAHVRTAQDILAQARRYGIDAGETAEVDLLSYTALS
jgi:citrate lyase subunit beta/citryl-CoA lyase